MGAHSTIYLSRAKATELYTQYMFGENKISDSILEDFFDKVLDERLYNCVIVSGDETQAQDYMVSMKSIEKSLGPRNVKETVVVKDGEVRGVMFAVSNDGGKTGVFWRDNVLECLNYKELYYKDSPWHVVAVRKPI